MENREGQVVVITGGGSGIGLAAARRFAREGAAVVLFGRNEPELVRACEELGGRATSVTGDVSDLADLDRLYATVRARHDGLDHLCVNAGIATWELCADASPEHFDRMFSINVRGAFFTAQKALPLLRAGGSIVFTTSVAGVLGAPRTSVYAATKAAVRSFTRTLAAELVGRGIRVNAVSPGPTETPIQMKYGPRHTPEVAGEMARVVVPRMHLGRLAKADEIAAAITFLASSNASFIVGQELAVDGGMTAL